MGTDRPPDREPPEGSGMWAEIGRTVRHAVESDERTIRLALLITTAAVTIWLIFYSHSNA